MPRRPGPFTIARRLGEAEELLGAVLDGTGPADPRLIRARAILDKASLDLAAHSGHWMVERHEMGARLGLRPPVTVEGIIARRDAKNARPRELRPAAKRRGR
jgi:hypothetical protein